LHATDIETRDSSETHVCPEHNVEGAEQLNMQSVTREIQEVDQNDGLPVHQESGDVEILPSCSQKSVIDNHARTRSICESRSINPAVSSTASDDTRQGNALATSVPSITFPKSNLLPSKRKLTILPPSSMQADCHEGPQDLEEPRSQSHRRIVSEEPYSQARDPEELRSKKKRRCVKRHPNNANLACCSTTCPGRGGSQYCTNKDLSSFTQYYRHRKNKNGVCFCPLCV
jgi:hypothetical protein